MRHAPYICGESCPRCTEERAALLAALESAPEPHGCTRLCDENGPNPAGGDCCEYRYWYNGPRAAALARVKA